MEQPTLTKEQIERAIAREGVYHPVISVMDSHADEISRFNQTYRAIENTQERERWGRSNLGFLADAIEKAGDFSMEPLDIVAIWSKTDEVGLRNGYALAGMVSTAYCIQGVPTPGWTGLPRYYSENGDLPEGVMGDKTGLLYVNGRLSEINRSLDELDFYVYGTREEPMQLTAELAKKEMDGDQEAATRLDQFIAYHKEHGNPILGRIHENFPNGLISLRLSLNEALGK